MYQIYPWGKKGCYMLFNIRDAVLGSHIKQVYYTQYINFLSLKGLIHPSNGNFILGNHKEISEKLVLPEYSDWVEFGITYDHDIWWSIASLSDKPLVDRVKLGKMVSHIIANLESGDKAYVLTSATDLELSKKYFFSQRLESSQNALNGPLPPELQHIVTGYLSAEDEEFLNGDPNLPLPMRPKPVFNIRDSVLGSYINQFYSTQYVRYFSLKGLIHPSNGDFILGSRDEIAEKLTLSPYCGWIEFGLSYDHDTLWEIASLSSDPLVDQTKLRKMVQHIIANLETGDKKYVTNSPEDLALSKKYFFSQRLEASQNALNGPLPPELQQLVAGYLSAEDEVFPVLPVPVRVQVTPAPAPLLPPLQPAPAAPPAPRLPPLQPTTVTPPPAPRLPPVQPAPPPPVALPTQAPPATDVQASLLMRILAHTASKVVAGAFALTGMIVVSLAFWGLVGAGVVIGGILTTTVGLGLLAAGFFAGNRIAQESPVTNTDRATYQC